MMGDGEERIEVRGWRSFDGKVMTEGSLDEILYDSSETAGISSQSLK